MFGAPECKAVFLLIGKSEVSPSLGGQSEYERMTLDDKMDFATLISFSPVLS
jgi:hypothetical protein